MAKVTIYLQDDIHGEAFFAFLRRQGYLMIDAYINSPEYKEAVSMNAEHLSQERTVIDASLDTQNPNNYHFEIIAKNEQSSDNLLREKKRKT